MKQYGLLLPHFGAHASRERLVVMAPVIERYGFDSVWVRDHLIFRPHVGESVSRTHVDPFVVLSVVAGLTKRLLLGTGVLIPYRHPVHTALMFGSLEFVAGTGRVIAGWGAGFYDHEFAAVGMADWNRHEVLKEQISVCRRLWAGEPIDHTGAYYRFTDVDVHPTPSGSIPIWYGGESAAAVRRAVEYCDGWLPGRLPRRDYARRMTQMREASVATGKRLPRAGAIPYVSPGRTMDAALRAVNVQALIQEAVSWKYTPPASGTFRSVEDLDGMLIAGPPDSIVSGVRSYQAVGAEHLVFDLRLRFADWEECVHLLGEEVLPQLHREDKRLGVLNPETLDASEPGGHRTFDVGALRTSRRPPGVDHAIE